MCIVHATTVNSMVALFILETIVFIFLMKCACIEAKNVEFIVREHGDIFSEMLSKQYFRA